MQSASAINLLTIGLPTLTVLVGILLNQNATSALRADITGLRGEMRSEIAALRNEITALRVSMHNDVVMLLDCDNKLEARVTRLEAAVKV